MRLIIQRVSEARVIINGQTHSEIGPGLLVLAGISDDDNLEDTEWLAAKLVSMRIFSDASGKMNLALADVGGDILIVSQFTLHADTKKGNRPSFIRAARPEMAIPLYEHFIKQCEIQLGKPAKSGVFGADMKIQLVNDGPVTIWLDSRSRE